MTEIPDFGLAGLRYDMRDKLGGACVECGVESDERVCAMCAVREKMSSERESEFQRGVVAERERVTRIIRDLPTEAFGTYVKVAGLLVALGVEDDT